MKYWKYIRTATFLVVGLMNTALIRPEDVGTMKNYIGWALLLLGICDVGTYIFKAVKKNSEKGRLTES